MSGICGLINIDHAPVAEAELRAMTSMLERRGPDGTRRWCDGHIGFGHTLLSTTPELIYESQPFRHAETGCAITADVRLDNRDELLNALNLGERYESIGDAELILRTYLEWNDDCLDRLLGDFAFAIYDPRHQKLFCARDHFGMRPFYYHNVPGQRFVFASDARAMLVLPQVPYQVNQGRIADFLVRELEWIDYTSTFFDGIHRLPPGHRATVTAAGVDVVEYWKPEPELGLAPMSDEDCEQGFLEVFTQAVNARLRAPANTVGSMLSGGMDSGSVVAVASEILSARGDSPLHTYSGVRRRGADCAESHAIYAALSNPSITPNLIQPDALQGIHKTLLSGNEEPYDGQFLILKSIYLTAHEKGQRVVLDGAGGDVVFSEGSYIVRLIRQGKLLLALAEIAAEKNFWDGTSFPRDLFRYARAAVIPEAIKIKLRPLRYRNSVRGFLKESLISREFANSVNIEDRCERLRQMFPEDWTPDFAVDRCNAIRPNVTAGRERYARLAAATATEASDPFLDRRVVDFCSGLPGRARLKDGWPKMMLRQLMSDRLPDEVLWGRGKPHIGWLFNDAITRQALNRGELSLDGLQAELNDYVDATALANAWHRFNGGGDAAPIHTAHILSVWLGETANRPVVPD